MRHASTDSDTVGVRRRASTEGDIKDIESGADFATSAEALHTVEKAGSLDGCSSARHQIKAPAPPRGQSTASPSGAINPRARMLKKAGTLSMVSTPEAPSTSPAASPAATGIAATAALRRVSTTGWQDVDMGPRRTSRQQSQGSLGDGTPRSRAGAGVVDHRRSGLSTLGSLGEMREDSQEQEEESDGSDGLLTPMRKGSTVGSCAPGSMRGHCPSPAHGAQDGRALSELRRDLCALREAAAENAKSLAQSDVKPPWGRRHVYEADRQSVGFPVGGANHRDGGRWQPLRYDQIAVLRREMAERPLPVRSMLTSNVPVPVDVVICGATGLLGPDQHSQQGVDTYCVCELHGRAEMRCQTAMSGNSFANTLEPRWNHTLEISEFHKEDWLDFQVFSGSRRGDVLIGQTKVSSEKFLDLEFGGEVPLRPTPPGAKPLLRLEIRVNSPWARARRAYHVVRSLPFLQSLGPEQGISLLQKAKLVDFEADDCIFEQGDPVDFMYVVASGSVRLEQKDPQQYGELPVNLSCVYDGQLFGDRSQFSRKLSAFAQEPTDLLQFSSSDYRKAYEEDSADSHPEPAWLGEQVANTSPVSGSARNFDGRVENLMKSKFFQEVNRDRLQHMASSVPEVELRYGDEFVKVGEWMECCYLIVEGVCKVYLPVDAVVSDDDEAQCPDQQSPNKTSDAEPAHAAVANSASSGPPKPGPDPSGARGLSLAGSLSARPASASAGGGQSSLSMRLINGGIANTLDVTNVPEDRLPLLSLLASGERPSFKTKGKPPAQRRTTPRVRRPGEPRPSTPWEETLRHESLGWEVSPSTEQVELATLYEGEAFGLHILKNEFCPEERRSSVSVRVQSARCKVLALTRRCLVYLPDDIRDKVTESMGDDEDPVKVTAAKLRDAQRERRHWTANKRDFVSREMLTARWPAFREERQEHVRPALIRHPDWALASRAKDSMGDFVVSQAGRKCLKKKGQRAVESRGTQADIEKALKYAIGTRKIKSLKEAIRMAEKKFADSFLLQQAEKVLADEEVNVTFQQLEDSHTYLEMVGATTAWAADLPSSASLEKLRALARHTFASPEHAAADIYKGADHSKVCLDAWLRAKDSQGDAIFEADPESARALLVRAYTTAAELNLVHVMSTATNMELMRQQVRSITKAYREKTQAKEQDTMHALIFEASRYILSQTAVRGRTAVADQTEQERLRLGALTMSLEAFAAANAKKSPETLTNKKG